MTMEYRQLGASGLRVPALSFGTGTLGGSGPLFGAWGNSDAQEARRLLAEAGFGPDRPLTVEYRFNISDNNRTIAVAIGEMWRDLGIVTRFVYTDAKTHFAYLRDGGDFDVARYSWIADYSDPQNFLFLAESDNKGLNYAS